MGRRKPGFVGINPDQTALYWRFSSFCNRKFSLKPENFLLQNSGLKLAPQQGSILIDPNPIDPESFIENTLWRLTI
jgi:hypothetical protein